MGRRICKAQAPLPPAPNKNPGDSHLESKSCLEEVFGEKACGKCGSENLRFVVRENDGNEFYELRCLDCGAKLAFGAHKQGGGLFPRRKDTDGNWLSDKGWQKWNPKTKSLE